MKILMIHGIGQEDSPKEELLKIWLETLINGIGQNRSTKEDLFKILAESLQAVQSNLLESPSVKQGLPRSRSVEMAYYGTTLAKLTNRSARTSFAVGMGAESTLVDEGDQDALKFISTVMEEFASKSQISDAQISAAMETSGGNAVPMDNFVFRRLVGLLRVVERISPSKGSILLRVIKQGHTYLYSPKAAKAVDDLVRPFLQKSPQVLITHSLGTVIAFKLLREMEEQGVTVTVPLLITMGSPLGLDAFKAKLGAPLYKPDSVQKWANFYDPSDFVTLGKPLNKKNFASNIYNDGTVDNKTDNCHGIIGYLPHKGVINAITKVLK
ncbi:alpha/beta hydrolase [Pseudomonas luteola]|uniref:Alpha/beta hydrolase n=1 Tax=Pseudomonas luteola TaxID=47886 RepID=A0ABS0FS55_PSELU|nr:alpha/beta hydrolase [Pseudomonas zeshuii]MBF8643132.1 alpha/beta hydrolase [Pseudomonas zeshuii]